MKVLNNNNEGCKVYFNERAYTDRMDVSLEISLYDYGVIRNPKSNRTIMGIGVNSNCEYNEFDFTYIGMAEVKSHLEEIEDSFFSFVGADSKEQYINELDNECLSHVIHSINMYDGHFKDNF